MVHRESFVGWQSAVGGQYAQFRVDHGNDRPTTQYLCQSSRSLAVRIYHYGSDVFRTAEIDKTVSQ